MIRNSYLSLAIFNTILVFANIAMMVYYFTHGLYIGVSVHIMLTLVHSFWVFADIKLHNKNKNE